MSWSCFDVSDDDGVAHVRLNRPDALNTFTPDFFRELREIASSLSDSGTTRAVVLSSTGKHFSAGLDLSASVQPREGELGRRRALFRSVVLGFQESITALERMRVPVLAAVQGGCVGGGLDLITAADCRYCTADAFFSVEAINRASPADLGALGRLPRQIPDGLARELAYTGRRMPAAEAREVGLVNQVFDTQDAMVTEVLSIARRIAGQSPLAVWGTKDVLNHSRDHGLTAGLERVALWQAGMLHETDTREAWKAFKEKRPGRFEDLLPE